MVIAADGIGEEVEGGQDFSTALAKYPKHFDNTYISLVKASEATGTLGPMLDRIANCVRSLVPPGGRSGGAPQELSFYVASGEPLSAMQGFADEFPRTSTKDALAPAALAAIRHLFSDAAAGVDHLVLLQTDFFFGYYESTFSLQVANERFRRGRASALHNAPWQEPAVCVPHQLWRNWR